MAIFASQKFFHLWGNVWLRISGFWGAPFLNGMTHAREYSGFTSNISPIPCLNSFRANRIYLEYSGRYS